MACLSREFDGTDDVLTLSIGACNFTGAISMAAIVRRLSDNTDDTVICITNSAASAKLRELRGLATLDAISAVVDGTGANSATGWTDEAAWEIIGWNKAGGAANPRIHRYIFTTDTWTHAVVGVSLGAGTAPGADGIIQIGKSDTGDPDWGHMRILAGAVWNTSLADAAFEALDVDFAAWIASSPLALWRFDQAATSSPVNDLTAGGANQTALVGTTVASDCPAVFDMGAGADGQPTMRRWGGVPHLGEGARFGGSW